MHQRYILFIFISLQADFSALCEHAQSIGSLIWSNEKSRTMVVTKAGHDDVKKFWKRYSKAGN